MGEKEKEEREKGSRKESGETEKNIANNPVFNISFLILDKQHYSGYQNYVH